MEPEMEMVLVWETAPRSQAGQRARTMFGSPSSSLPRLSSTSSPASSAAYFELHFTERTEALLRQNRKLAEEFLKIARVRYPASTATQPDVLRAEVAVSDIDREIENNVAALDEPGAELTRLMNMDPESEIRTVTDLPVTSVPTELDRLRQLALASRPDLQGRLAAIERDQAAIELARKRYYPNISVGLVYQDMEKTNAMTPRRPRAMPNVGLFVGMNLPVYHKKLAAGVCEAQARAAADANSTRPSGTSRIGTSRDCSSRPRPSRMS